jgi:hypothetical protein
MGRRSLIAIVLAVALLFISNIVFLAWRDNRAVDRCEALGGQTWDSGQHCAIGVDRVVDTHDRVWG